MTCQVIGILISLSMGTWVWHDAKRRGKSQLGAAAWGISTAAFVVFFFPLWFIVRPLREKKEGAPD